MIVWGKSFEPPEGQLRARNIYLRESPAFDVAVFERGTYVVASQGLRRKVSLIDVDAAEIVDRMAPDNKGVSALAVETAALPASGVYVGSVFVGDYDGDSISLLDVDPYFGVFRFVADAELGLRKRKLGVAEAADRPTSHRRNGSRTKGDCYREAARCSSCGLQPGQSGSRTAKNGGPGGSHWRPRRVAGWQPCRYFERR